MFLFEIPLNLKYPINLNHFWILIGDFLDNFNREPSLSLILEEPIEFDLNLNSFLSGIAEKLARDNNLEVPMWVYDTKYKLKEPFFVGGFKNEYRIFLLRETPNEFKVKNIFCAENILNRV